MVSNTKDILFDAEPTIKRMAAEFSRKGLVAEHKVVTEDDLVQVGWEAALIALESYDANRGVKFITYAYNQIWRRMLAEVHRHGDSIRMPEYLHWYVVREVATAMDTFLQAKLRDPTVDELLDDDVLMQKLEGNRDTRGADMRALLTDAVKYLTEEQVLSIDADDSLMEIAEDDDNANPSHIVERGMLSDAIEEALDILSDVEYDVLTMRLGFADEEFTLREIGDELDLSYEAVRKIEQRALDKLRKDPRARAILRNWG